MSSRFLIHLAVFSLAVVVLLSGCSRKIVKPGEGPAGPGMPAPYGAAQVGEHDLQVVQAELRVIYFDYDRFGLTPESQAAVQYNAEVLRRAPHLKVIAEGHCDERGTPEYNLALGERRARSVVDYLIALDVVSPRLSTVSYGSELPVDPAHNEAAWAKNRRVYLRVSR